MVGFFVEVKDLKITLNGKELTLPNGITIAELISQKQLKPETVIVEHNSELVKKETWAGIVLKENDRLEILRFVGGG